MDSPSKHVLYLARKIGARRAGSDGEAAAASYVMRQMRDFCDDVELERFSSWRSDLPPLAAIYITGVVAYMLFPLSYVASFLLGVAAFLLFQMETYAWAVVSKLFPRSPASNIVGRVHPAGERRQLVVLVANYDTARSSPLGRPRAARAYRVIYIASFICLTLIGILGLIGIFGSVAKFHGNSLFTLWVIFSPFAAYLLVISGIMLWGEIFGRFSPGANDNASGVGVMLSALESFAENRLQHAEVWGVATARSWAGGRGMVEFIKRHPAQVKRACVINIDHAGRGKTVVFKREGPMFGFSPNRRFKRLVLLAASKTPNLDVGKGRCRVKKSDAMVAMVRWVTAITVGGADRGSYEGWRRADDVYHKIDQEALDMTLKLVTAVLKEIDASEGRKQAPISSEPTAETESL